jgi:hypothetical protein
LVLQLAAWPLLASAAQTEPRPAPRAVDAEERAGAGRDEAVKMIDAYILSNLQESLGLSDEAYVRLLPLIKRQHGERRELNQRRMQALWDLRRELRQGRATEQSVAEGLKQIKKIEAEAPLALARNQQAIDAQLDPVQQAKYRVFEAEVDRKVRELLRQARHRRGVRRGSPDAEP